MPAARQRSRSPVHRVRGHGDDAQVTAVGCLALPDGGSGVEPAHFGHLHIHQHDVEDVSRSSSASASQPIVGDGDRVTSFRQQSDGDALIDDVVFREQHVAGRATRGGSGTVSRERCRRRRRVIEHAADRVVQLGRLDRLGEIGGRRPARGIVRFPRGGRTS